MHLHYTYVMINSKGKIASKFSQLREEMTNLFLNEIVQQHFTIHKKYFSILVVWSSYHLFASLSGPIFFNAFALHVCYNQLKGWNSIEVFSAMRRNINSFFACDCSTTSDYWEKVYFNTRYLIFIPFSCVLIRSTGYLCICITRLLW